MFRWLRGAAAPSRRWRKPACTLSTSAVAGFQAFHVDVDPDCGNCHRMPYWVSTGTVGTGMDAPTWRGAYDRWLLLPQGRLNILDAQNAIGTDVQTHGFVERTMWGIAGATELGGCEPVLVLDVSAFLGAASTRLEAA